jgi:hypothetical protein
VGRSRASVTLEGQDNVNQRLGLGNRCGSAYKDRGASFGGGHGGRVLRSIECQCRLGWSGLSLLIEGIYRAVNFVACWES